MKNDYALHNFTMKKNLSPLSVFQKLVSDGNIKFNFGLISVNLKNDDLRRVHSIVHEIDERRAFYTALEHEIPEYFLKSVKETKTAISNTFKEGLWGNAWAREVAQIIMHDLGEFVTTVEQNPVPKTHRDKGFDVFAQSALELRLKAWTAVAHYVVVFGSAITPLHLPNELYTAVLEEYKLVKGQKSR